jgi:hypothetical protein
MNAEIELAVGFSRMIVTGLWVIGGIVGATALADYWWHHRKDSDR